MRPFLIFISALLIQACASPSQNTDAILSESNIPITKTLRAGRYSNIYFSGQPQKSEWQHLKDEGFTHIINFRESSEYDEASERKKVEALGMHYTQLPMSPQSKLTKQKIAAVTRSVMNHRDKGKTLIHCGSGNRVAYWAGAHFYLDHKYSKEKSLKLAKEMGLTSEKFQQKLLEFIEKTN